MAEHTERIRQLFYVMQLRTNVTVIISQLTQMSADLHNEDALKRARIAADSLRDEVRQLFSDTYKLCD